MNSISVTQHQKFEIQTLHRSQLKEAAYNPRVIGENERNKLKAKIKEVGLVEPLLFNKQTGNLVGGHQRLSILDELNGGKDYSLTVSVVDIPLDAEKRLNVFMNNPSTQGQFDIEGLENIIRDLDMSFDGMGFDNADIQLMCESPDIATMFDKEPMQSTIEEIQAMKDRKKKVREDGKSTDDAEFYFTVTCNSRADADALMIGLGFGTDSRYVNGHDIAARLKIAMPSDGAETQLEPANTQA